MTALRLIRSPAELRAYREEELTPDRVRERLLQARGPLLIQLDPGVGKTSVIDGMIEAHRRAGRGLLIYLTSQRSVIHERPWVREHRALSRARRATHDIAILEGRPRARCGALDAEWSRYERAGCATLGRTELCSRCPARRRCAWPGQRTSAALNGKRVIAATQANLATTPQLVAEFAAKSGADEVVVVLDEAPVLESTFRRALSYEALETSRAIFAAAGAPPDWLTAHDVLLDAGVDPTEYERPGRLPAQVATAVQRAGLAAGGVFRFLAHDLLALPYGAPQRTTTGVEFLARPWLRGQPCLIAAAGMPIELARHRLGTPLVEEFTPDVRFLHEGSDVYNIASAVGTARYFPTHRGQILFAMAQLIVRLAREGKRALVVVKKKFAAGCCTELEGCLRTLGSALRVVLNPSERQVHDPAVVPLITYGARGVNRYEHFDAALSLCGYHAREDVLERHHNDVYGPSDQVRLEFTRVDGKRVAHATDYGQTLRGFSALASDYQHQHETAIAEQALGRVRFAVRPRLVVFFQLGPLRYPLTRDFRTLDSFRRHFDLTTRREWQKRELAQRVAERAATGATVTQIAAQLGLSERQVYRIRASARQEAP